MYLQRNNNFFLIKIKENLLLRTFFAKGSVLLDNNFFLIKTAFINMKWVHKHLDLKHLLKIGDKKLI